MNRSRIRSVFWVLIVLLPLQYALVGLVQLRGGSEPWPLLVMPGFKATWHEGKPLLAHRVTFVVHYAGGSIQSVPADSVLAFMPYSHHQAMLDAFFRPASLSGTPATERIRHPEATRWLWSRLQQLTGKIPARVDIVWEQLQIMSGTGLLLVQPLDTLRVQQP